MYDTDYKIRIYGKDDIHVTVSVVLSNIKRGEMTIYFSASFLSKLVSAHATRFSFRTKKKYMVPKAILSLATCIIMTNLKSLLFYDS